LSDQPTIYLFDYEFSGYQKNGLDLIEEYQLHSKAILVTNRYEEDHIKEKCEKLHIGIIPKMVVEFLPIVLEENKLNQVESLIVYIENNKLLRRAWENSAKKHEIKLLILESPSDLTQYRDQLHKQTTFYIDSDLGDDQIKGEDVAKSLFEQGFSELYLATGYDQKKFHQLNCIKGVVGKEPPWENNSDLHH
jgi:hypothetical protein